MISYAIFGCGGLGRELLPQVRERLRQDIEAGTAQLLFVVEDGYPTADLPAARVVGLSTFIRDFEGQKKFFVAIADPAARRRITQTCIANGMEPFDIRHPGAIVAEGSSFGWGAQLAPFSLVSTHSTVGNSLHLNYYACIAHDCVIGDFVTFGPRAQCNGHVVIGDGVYIGAGALIKNGSANRMLTIGQGAVIGMGAVVLRDVPPGVTVVGNPARELAGKKPMNAVSKSVSEGRSP